VWWVVRAKGWCELVGFVWRGWMMVRWRSKVWRRVGTMWASSWRPMVLNPEAPRVQWRLGEAPRVQWRLGSPSDGCRWAVM
jgi:hypothetical protein